MRLERSLARFFSLSLIVTFLLASAPLTSARGARRDHIRYEFEIELSTVIEGTVVDSETGDPVGGAQVDGEARPEPIHINVTADENGHFRVALPGGEDHTYVINISAPGYDPLTITGSVKASERKNLGQIGLNYNPFDLSVDPSSGSLTRGFSPYTVRTGSSSSRSTGWELYESLGLTAADTAKREAYESAEGWRVEPITETYTDTVSLPASASSWILAAYGVQGYKVTPEYTNETYTYMVQVGTRIESISLPASAASTWAPVAYWMRGYTLTPEYTNETYRSWEKTETERYREWVPGHYETRTRPATYQTWWVTGWHWEWRLYGGTYWYPIPVPEYGWVTHTKMVTYRVWIPGHYVWATRDVYGWVTRTRQVLSGYTASKRVPVYETRMGLRQVLSGYTALKEVTRTTGYEVQRQITTTTTTTTYRTDYSALPWPSAQAAITVTPKNGYENLVRLECTASSGIQAQLESASLTFSSPASTTLTLTPGSKIGSGTFSISVRGSDANGRLVETAVYSLSLTSNRPASYSWSESGSVSRQAEELENTTLTVKTTPVSGEVFVNGMSWGIAPQTRTLDPGAYTVSFGPVDGYTTPDDQTVTLAAGDDKTVTGIYTVPRKTTLTVKTTPVSGVLVVWSSSETYTPTDSWLEAHDWGYSPQTREVQPGSYTVSFGPVDGYTTPDDQTVTLAAGENKTVIGVYTRRQDFSILVSPSYIHIGYRKKLDVTVSVIGLYGFSGSVLVEPQVKNEPNEIDIWSDTNLASGFYLNPGESKVVGLYVWIGGKSLTFKGSYGSLVHYTTVTIDKDQLPAPF